MERRFSYDEMQGLTYKNCQELVKELNGEMISIKGHDVFLLDFKDDWGYSAIVFLNRKHLYYADDYQLHHRYTVTNLRKWYIDSMNRKLYSLEELQSKDIEDYDEYKARDYYIRNYFTQQYDKLSIFGIGEEAQSEFNRRKRYYKYFSNVGFGYFKEESIVKLLEELITCNEEQWKDLQNNNELFRKAIKRELWNYECCISDRVDEALASLGLSISELNDLQLQILREEYNKCVDDYCKGE